MYLEEKIIKISGVFQLLALVYPNISQLKNLELSTTSVSKFIALRKTLILQHGRYTYCAHCIA
jgi:hypothetical protein